MRQFKQLHSSAAQKGNYELMMSGDLNFFRGRTIKKDSNEVVTELEHICSLPYSKRQKSNDLRFSAKNEICLYLGTTTYVCAQECKWDVNSQNLYVAAFKFNQYGKKLKILNLVFSEPLINGVYHKSLDISDNYRRELQNIMIKLFPLVIATSFTVKTTDEERKTLYGEDEKHEYLLSQRLIKAIKKADIDGIAYLSRQGKNDLQYPHGVNLAIPMNDISAIKEYSDLYELFEITQPVLLNEDILSKELMRNEISYINRHYPEYRDNRSLPDPLSEVNYEGESTFYGKTPFSIFDNYLINQQYKKFDK